VAEFLLTQANTGVDFESAMEQKTVSITGVVSAMGIDGFLTKQLELADYFRQIENTLTDEQKEIIQDWKDN